MHKVLLILMVVLLIAPAYAKSAGEPVMVGGDTDQDACVASGVVHGLRTIRAAFLVVRNGAHVHSRKIDQLREGQSVFVCDTSANGHWLGIVYSSNKEINDCGVSTPIAIEQPYRGKCRKGWVNARWIKLIAG
jgi:uncharacterized protein YgiM (DUF1202 family)